MSEVSRDESVTSNTSTNDEAAELADITYLQALENGELARTVKLRAGVLERQVAEGDSEFALTMTKSIRRALLEVERRARTSAPSQVADRSEELLELCEVSAFTDGETHVCVRECDHDGYHRSAAGVEWETFGERMAAVFAEVLADADDTVYAAIGRGMFAIRAEWPDSFTISDIDVIASAVDIPVSDLLERAMQR